MMLDIRLTDRNYAINIVQGLFIKAKSPGNISYAWNFGSILGIVLILQVITGIELSFHYIPSTDLAFYSIQAIMIEENYGWLLRYMHSNGASLFFLYVYIHIGRSIYFYSYLHPRVGMWNIGAIMYIIMMASAFLGYVLVWGTMSLWGAIVITNFVTVVVWIGTQLVLFIWGGFSVGLPTLGRFFGLHFTLPFILTFLSFLHICTLHNVGSNNPNGYSAFGFSLLFHPYFVYKDYITFILYFMQLIVLVGYYPNLLSHPDNYNEANLLVTPSSIVPEWYFLPFYAILRSIESKPLGVMMMGLAIVVLFVIPHIASPYTRSSNFNPTLASNFWWFVSVFVVLLLMGSSPVEYPFNVLGFSSTLSYFYCIIGYPILISMFINLFDCIRLSGA